MINAPLSVYYVTKYEASLWKPLHEREDAEDWRDPNWINKNDSTFPIKEAAPDDMEANPHRRWCKEHQLPLGTPISRVSNAEYKKALILTLALEPLKHIAGAFESAFRLPASLIVYGTAKAGKALNLDNLFSARAKEGFENFQEQLQSPKRNAKLLITELSLSVLMLFVVPCVYSQNANTRNIHGLHKDFSRRVEEMDGRYMPTWRIYQEMSKV